MQHHTSVQASAQFAMWTRTWAGQHASTALFVVIIAMLMLLAHLTPVTGAQNTPVPMSTIGPPWIGATPEVTPTPVGGTPNHTLYLPLVVAYLGLFGLGALGDGLTFAWENDTTNGGMCCGRPREWSWWQRKYICGKCGKSQGS